MLDIAPSELLAVAVIALLVIGPKDLPRVMRVVGQWVGKARGMARHFRSGFDNMIREAELEDMEKKWKEENERIMQAYPSTVLLENTPVVDHPPVEAVAPVEPGLPFPETTNPERPA
ncbi:MAG: tatB [Sphingomonadales bacterium]|jgi:sec-independent protein translocase protein TatB|nr:tatB [Sphingomonadales bacterium]